MDGDRPGVAKRTLDIIRSWPPGLPVFGLLTPYPATPLYERLALAAGSPGRNTGWNSSPSAWAFPPLGISSDQAEAEVREAWESSYTPAANASATRWLESRPFPDRVIHMLSRLAFRGIYFPQMRRRDWIRMLFQNRSSILRVLSQALKMRLRLHPKEILPRRSVMANLTESQRKQKTAAEIS